MTATLAVTRSLDRSTRPGVSVSLPSEGGFACSISWIRPRRSEPSRTVHRWAEMCRTWSAARGQCRLSAPPCHSSGGSCYRSSASGRSLRTVYRYTLPSGQSYEGMSNQGSQSVRGKETSVCVTLGVSRRSLWIGYGGRDVGGKRRGCSRTHGNTQRAQRANCNGRIHRTSGQDDGVATCPWRGFAVVWH